MPTGANVTIHDGVLKSVLIAVDLSQQCDQMWARIARLPLADDAVITMLHVVPKELDGAARLRALHDARELLDSLVSRGPTSLAKRPGVRHEVRVGTPWKEISAMSEKTSADLVVLGRGAGRPLRDLTLGSTAERVLRGARVPVLVVRRAARRGWEAPLAALDVDSAAPRAVAFARRLLPGLATLDVVHASSAPFDGLIYPHVGSVYMRTYEANYRRERLAALEKKLGRVSVKLHGRNGLARVVVPETVRQFGADLLILGTAARSAAGNAVLGTVAGDLLRGVSCDVLVVPAVKS